MKNDSSIPKKLCFFVGLPLLLVSSIYCYLYKLVVLDSILFMTGVIFCIPALFDFVNSKQDESYQALIEEFSKMSSPEFIDAGKQILHPLCMRATLTRAAYRDVYKKRFGRESEI